MRSRKLPLAAAAFLRTEAASGVVLAGAAAVALLWANSPWSATYETLRHGSVAGIGVERAISEGLMTVFFLVVGLEITRELRERDRQAAALPVVAAVGGMVVPALIFVAVNAGGDHRGWAIPTATDIAFALGALTLLGSRVPAELRTFLLTLAITDDVLAIVVLALFYGTPLSPGWLLAAVVPLAAVTRARHALVLVPLTVAAWLALHAAGVHPALAGVAVGTLTPRALAGPLEHRSHPWSANVVLPLFALANAGVALARTADALTSTVGVGVVLGLVVGKPLGIVAASALAVRSGRCTLPAAVSWRQIVGIGCIAGTGFTVSLFVTSLAYPDAGTAATATIGIVTGSLLAAALGAVVLAQTDRDHLRR